MKENIVIVVPKNDYDVVPNNFTTLNGELLVIL